MALAKSSMWTRHLEPLKVAQRTGMGMVCWIGRMVVGMLEVIAKTKSMAKASSCGPMDAGTVASGSVATGMVMVHTPMRGVKSDAEDGLRIDQSLGKTRFSTKRTTTRKALLQQQCRLHYEANSVVLDMFRVEYIFCSSYTGQTTCSIDF